MATIPEEGEEIDHSNDNGDVQQVSVDEEELMSETQYHHVYLLFQ